MLMSRHAARFLGENRMLEMTNENFARLLRGLTIAVGNRRNRILLYQFLAAEIRALHSVSAGPKRSWLCRGPQCRERISRRRGALRTSAGAGGRSPSPPSSRDRCPWWPPRGACSEGREHDRSHRLHSHWRGPGPTWLGRQL